MCAAVCFACFVAGQSVGIFPVRVVESNYELIRHRNACGPDVQLQLVVYCNVSRFPWQFPRIIDDEQIDFHIEGRPRKRKWCGRETRRAVLRRKNNIIERSDSRSGWANVFPRMQHVLAVIWNNCMH